MQIKLLKLLFIKLIELINHTTLNLCIIEYKIPKNVLKKHIENDDIKYINFFGKKIINTSSVKNFKKNILENNYIHNISVDDQHFKMSFGNYKIDEGIFERINGIREPSTVAVLKSIIKEKNKILEIGSCYGYFTIIMSQIIGDKGKILSIEGTPNNYNILNRNLQLNDILNVETHNLFISSYGNEDVYFSHSAKNAYNATINKKGVVSNKIKSDFDIVKSIRLSNFLIKKNFFPDLIFMDIEGYEVNVFEDISNILFEHIKPTILFEIHHGYYKNNKNLDYLKNILKSHNYSFREVDNNLLCYINEL